MPPACETGWRRTDESTDADGVKCRVDSHAKGMSLQVVGNPLGCTKRILPALRPEPGVRTKQIYAFSGSIRNSGAQIPSKAREGVAGIDRGKTRRHRHGHIQRKHGRMRPLKQQIILVGESRERGEPAAKTHRKEQPPRRR